MLWCLGKYRCPRNYRVPRLLEIATKGKPLTWSQTLRHNKTMITRAQKVV
ncbi:hypothetical protein IF2G_06273 [Cordyceps javanica]|nr:hypothetical protein IF2G_06273 [Cordyceps javanica]